MKIEIKEHGVMLPDYFQGTNGVWLNVYIDNKTTILKVIELLKQEIDDVFDHIEYIAEYHKYNGNISMDIDRELQAMRIYVSENGTANKVYSPNLDPPEGDADYMDSYPVAIFTIEFVED